MEPKDVIKISTMDSFYALLDKLNLTDRQREIFVMKFSRGWRNIDIAEELNTTQYTVGDDLKVIREKLAAIGSENMKDHGMKKETDR